MSNNIEELKENEIQVYETVEVDGKNVRRYTKEYLIYKMQEVYKEHGEIKWKYFRNKYSRPSEKAYRNRFGNLRNAMKASNIELTDEQEHFWKTREMTDDELLEELRRYNREIGFPTTVGLQQTEGYVTPKAYYNRFGSFEKALELSGLDIPKTTQQRYDNISISNDKLLELLKEKNEEHLKDNITLLSGNQLLQLKDFPKRHIYESRFGSLSNAYDLIGYNYEVYNTNAIKNKMVEDYLALEDKLGRLPTNEDIANASIRGETFAPTSYVNYWGGLDNLKISLGYKPTYVAKHTTEEELLGQIRELALKLGRIPSSLDIKESEDIPSLSVYTRLFGSYEELLIEAGFSKEDIDNRYLITKGGHRCLSNYEFDFCTMLEEHNFNFKKEQMYKDYISNHSSLMRFDFTLFVEGKTYQVEIFGMMGMYNYNEKVEEKIQICKENEIKLIPLYQRHFRNKTQDDLYSELVKQIESLKK